MDIAALITSRSRALRSRRASDVSSNVVVRARLAPAISSTSRSTFAVTSVARNFNHDIAHLRERRANKNERSAKQNMMS